MRDTQLKVDRREVIEEKKPFQPVESRELGEVVGGYLGFFVEDTDRQVAEGFGLAPKRNR